MTIMRWGQDCWANLKAKFWIQCAKSARVLGDRPKANERARRALGAKGLPVDGQATNPRKGRIK